MDKILLTVEGGKVTPICATQAIEVVIIDTTGTADEDQSDRIKLNVPGVQDVCSPEDFERRVLMMGTLTPGTVLSPYDTALRAMYALLPADTCDPSQGTDLFVEREIAPHVNAVEDAATALAEAQSISFSQALLICFAITTDRNT